MNMPPNNEYPAWTPVAGLAQRNGWVAETIGQSVQGLPIVAWFPGDRPVTRVVWGAIHGEEAPTLLLLHTLLRSTPAEDSCAVVVPVANPDGVLHGTRQNVNGVDLNRNFPASTWGTEYSYTYWPTTMTRQPAFRTQRSSPGTSAGSEPETQALIALIDRVQPDTVIDIHAPLECVIAIDKAGVELAEYLAEPSGMPVVRQLENPTPGDSAQYCIERDINAITYEIEVGPFPALWKRHSESLARAIVDKPLRSAPPVI